MRLIYQKSICLSSLEDKLLEYIKKNVVPQEKSLKKTFHFYNLVNNINAAAGA
jgi:hypothetical protein